MCMRGRFHYYEGNSMEVVITPVRVFRLLGVKILVVTNAAGGLNPIYNVGDIMVIQDHFGMPAIAGNHPLRGINDEEVGPRFPAVSDAYDEGLQRVVATCARELNISRVLRQDGTYCFVSGPAYESRAESRFLRSIGGDSVGMSTVPEVLAAKHCGMKVLGLSLITNKVVMDRSQTLHATHTEVLENVQSSGRNVLALVKAFISKEKIGDYLNALPDAPLPRKPAPGVITARNVVFVGIAAAATALGFHFARDGSLQRVARALPQDVAKLLNALQATVKSLIPHKA